MKKIADKIKELGFSEYAVCHEHSKAYLLVFMSYGYYTEKDEDNFSVSPYYFASNKAYFASKELRDYICSLGYAAEVQNKIVYDNLLEKCGALRGRNNLFFTEESGSLFCVHVIETDAPIEDKAIKGKKCINCRKCEMLCPMNALGKGVDKCRCLRHRMDIIDDTEGRDKITTLLGCDICQKVCPNNCGKRVIKTYPQFNKQKVLEGDMTGIADLVGKNMARKTRLQFQGICLITNSHNRAYLNIINSIQSELLNNSKKWCNEILKNIDLEDGK